jgi:hypothetical protein
MPAGRADLDPNNDLRRHGMCRRQRGAFMNGVRRFGLRRHRGMTAEEERMEETRRHLEAAQTLRSSATWCFCPPSPPSPRDRLTGTTRGMIRAFSAMSSQGMPDASQLALGISEALWNTLLGLAIAQVGIVAFNYFSTRVDNYNFMMDETVHEILQLLSRKEKSAVA